MESETPLTDKEENFFYYEVPRPSMDYGRNQRPGKNREGFVSSAFARKLERELRKLKNG
jgi:hypothetical protein